jgi:hypothetical protein
MSGVLYGAPFESREDSDLSTDVEFSERDVYEFLKGELERGTKFNELIRPDYPLLNVLRHIRDLRR